MPLPGPPAENDPPPPISMLSTQNAMKSSSLWEQLSSPTTMCANSGIGVGPRLTFDKSFVTYITQIHNQLHRLVTITISSEYTRFWCCPHSMQWSVYVMIRCPSVRPSICPVDRRAACHSKGKKRRYGLTAVGTTYQLSSNICRCPSCGLRHAESQGTKQRLLFCSFPLIFFVRGSVL